MEEIRIKNRTLKSEDCAVIAQRAGHFRADIRITKGSTSVNAKSIMGVISLQMKKDDVIYVDAQGIDETDAIRAIIDVLKKY